MFSEFCPVKNIAKAFTFAKSNQILSKKALMNTCPIHSVDKIYFPDTTTLNSQASFPMAQQPVSSTS